jgi:hypothetical protein
MKNLSLAGRWMGVLAGASLLTGAFSAFTQTANTNPPITITAPASGSSFSAPTNILIDALAFDPSNNVAAVAFIAAPGGPGVINPLEILLGTVSNGVPSGAVGSHEELYACTWTNAPGGVWVITAQTLNSNGLVKAISPPVVIAVLGSNLAPVVRITCPPNNAVFLAPVDIALLAYANDPAGYVASVEFFAGSNSLGFGLPLPSAQPPPSAIPPGPPLFQTNSFELIWSNAPVGSNAITAVAIDNLGLAATSAPVNITVLPQPPPATNRVAVVSIVATDPIAIAGTNCWVWLGLADTNVPPCWSNWVSPVAVLRWFTNCGPEDATFTVCRAGATNSSLTVPYSIGGTASNGVDYAALPGVVTIPAGQTEAMITIVPMNLPTNSAANTAIQTVILSLTPSTNNPANYVLGFPPRAEALILDSESPHPHLAGATLGDHSFHVNTSGPDGAWFRVDGSTNGTGWVPLCTNQVVNGSIDFADPDAPGLPMRFYRAVPLTNAPSN